MKRAFINLLMFLSGITLMAQTGQGERTFYEIKTRGDRFAVNLAAGKVVFQADSARWLKLTHMVFAGWKLDTVYKMNWWQPAEVAGSFVPLSRSISTTSPLAGGGSLSGNLTLSMPAANGTTGGYLSSTDWNTFNGKVSSPFAAGGGIITNPDSALSFYWTGGNGTSNSFVSAYLGGITLYTMKRNGYKTGGQIAVSSGTGVTTISAYRADKYATVALWGTSGLLTGQTDITHNSRMDIGSSGSRFGDIYATHLNTDSTITASGGNSTNWNAGYAAWADVNTYGFLNQTETSISFNPTNYTFTLSGTSWSYYRAGVKYTISGNKTIPLTGSPPASGLWYIYIDATNGALSALQTPWTLIGDTKVPVAYVYWNNACYPKYQLGEERHTCRMPRWMHAYEHLTSGTKAVTAGILNRYTVGSDQDTSKTIQIYSSQIADEDIFQTLPSLSKPATSDSAYTVFYHTSASTWTWKKSQLPYAYTTSGYINYDNMSTLVEGSGGAGSNARYYNSYILYTNLSGSARFAIIMGQQSFTSLAAAQAETATAFDFTGFPISEFIVAYQLTWSTVTSTSKGKCVLAAVPKRINVSVSYVAGTAGVNHNSLSGLNTGDYMHLTASEYSTQLAKVSSQWIDGTESINYNGSVGIGNDTPTEKLYVEGNVFVSKNVKQNAVPSTDTTASGIVVSLTAATILKVGDVVFVNNSGQAALCKADVITGCPYAFAICTAYVAASGTGTFLTKGSIRKSSWNWTVGKLLYIRNDAVAGTCLTETPPSSSNNVIMPVAVALTATTIYFFGNVNSVEKL